MKIIFMNILALIVGILVFFICDLIVAPLLYLIAQIPILGKIIFFLGTNPVQIIANYSLWANTGLTFLTAYNISLPDKKGRRWGMLILTTLMVLFLFAQGLNILKLYGFNFDLVTYIISSIVIICMGYYASLKG